MKITIKREQTETSLGLPIVSNLRYAKITIKREGTTKLIIAVWLLSWLLMPTDNIVQGLIALCCFGGSSWLLRGRKVEAENTVKWINNAVEKLINK